MKKNIFLDYVRKADFRGLFISEMGWNNYHGQAELPLISIDDTNYQFCTIAERSGFQILQCEVDAIPAAAVCKRIDTKLRRNANDYIAIYVLRGTEHHQWVAPVKQMEKRDIVTIEYECADKADFLFSKIDGLSFENSERTTIMDVKERVQTNFAINSEKITKDFYDGFKKEHNAFAKFITGIDDQIDTKQNRNKQWYTSVMLNRLMFCYFIQKKGFLDSDVNYLKNKLQWCQREKGEDRFFSSFYKGFLVQLFQDGLNSPTHRPEFEQVYGRIPYLNGGMFDRHQIEQDYADIDIADEAFENLFTFFDKWNWYLDTRISASGKDINPDVLGYIFEQYINDRAQMGAYYTKEDITEYIGRNCILPFLFDKVQHATQEMEKAFLPEGEVWQTLRTSGDRYIFDAVKHGYTSGWKERIPEEIAIGIDTKEPGLLERRAKWNTPTPEPFALPTEIWRETIERLQRCEHILKKISAGDITEINDFITYNLDIRRFAQDLLGRTTNHLLVKQFYKALQNVTILDPTCGSGAFLFAAMNILEPLYEVCIDRIQEFNERNPNLFKDELAEIKHKYRSNIQYFIFKSIILRNLYGVDIMAEATEIAKLRLFLKMVAVVEANRRQPNLGLDPLPDVDFNIRCGNTLVGYANENEAIQGASADFFTQQEFREKITLQLQAVSMAYDHFRTQQLADIEDMAAVKESKKQLKERLEKLTDLLDQQLFSASGGNSFDDWKTSHQPFHWFAEYYQIINGNGGFDVIIGNPPYVEYNKKDKKTGKAISDLYKLKGYKTLSCGNLYAFILERCKALINNASYIGMIIPLSGYSTERMSPLVTNFFKKFGLRLHLNLSADANPQRLFEGVKFRLGIFFVSNAHKGCFSSKYTRWFAEERKVLFSSIVKYNNEEDYSYNEMIGKISSPLYLSIFKKMMADNAYFFGKKGNKKCLYHNAPVNWIRSHSFIPYFCSERDGEGVTTQLKSLYFDSDNDAKVASCILNSSLFFIWWITNSDCYHLNNPEITNFRFNKDKGLFDIIGLADKLAKDMLSKSKRRIYNYATSGRVEYDEFYMKLSKPIIDEIDKVLAKHYGFTDEELDFIINYDIKYRMGDELNANNEE